MTQKSGFERFPCLSLFLARWSGHFETPTPTLAWDIIKPCLHSWCSHSRARVSFVSSYGKFYSPRTSSYPVLQFRCLILLTAKCNIMLEYAL